MSMLYQWRFWETKRNPILIQNVETKRASIMLQSKETKSDLIMIDSEGTKREIWYLKEIWERWKTKRDSIEYLTPSDIPRTT